MAHCVLTVIGDDREGLVSALSRTLESHGGNWLDSQFTRLAGKFAGIVLVELPSAQLSAFEESCAGLLGEVGLHVEVTAAQDRSGAVEPRKAAPSPVSSAAGHEVRVHLVGLDRPGTVRQVSTALAQQRVSIGTFRSWTRAAPEGGGVLFEAEALVTVPAGLEVEVVRAALEPIADELMVDLDLDEQG
ncbi:glycine cleavage system protein R [Brachybacterium hainanense]|uniref:Glycine cleavage system protein R n=1 Tax=Brachybacterium hainanense TaxID=1541174 RepID=A0ABV6R996_9MICO